MCCVVALPRQVLVLPLCASGRHARVHWFPSAPLLASVFPLPFRYLHWGQFLFTTIRSWLLPLGRPLAISKGTWWPSLFVVVPPQPNWNTVFEVVLLFFNYYRSVLTGLRVEGKASTWAYSTATTLSFSHGGFCTSSFYRSHGQVFANSLCMRGPFGLRFLLEELNKDWGHGGARGGCQ